MVADVVFAGGAVQTSASGVMTPSSPGGGGTFTVADATGYPVTGRFPVKLDKGTDSEEHVMIASRSGTTFTVESRGYDGTGAQAHDNPTVEIYFDATTANILVAHVDDDEADPHATKLLNNARHDLPARHVYGGAGTAFGTRPTPVGVGTANAAGSSNTPAAGDHVHELLAGSIDAANLFVAGVVDQAAIGNNAVGTAELIDGNVTQDKLVTGPYVPIGGMIIWGDTSIPSNYAFCQGQAISRTTFATLFALWGTRYGAGDGSTTFNVPDLRQRFPMGVAASGTGNALAGTGGTIDHVHALDTTSSHAKLTVSSVAPQVRAIRKAAANWSRNFEVAATSGAGGAGAETTGIELGGDSAAANPPFLALHFIVRTL